ncbi:MAG: hypothetical protein WCA84_00185 [Ignavibacteriaceae bacterium]
MKVIIILSFLMLPLLSCSSIYTVNDFSSKEKFYEDVNNAASNRVVRITLINDSSYISESGANISNDSLRFSYKTANERIKLSFSEIKNIKYFGNNSLKLSAIIELNNGKEFQADSVSPLSDTINASVSKLINKSLSCNKIKEVSYKERWFGILQGFSLGAVAGLAAGYLVSSIENKNNSDNRSRENGYIGIAVTFLGAVTGILWGGISGYKYIYEFNP